MIMSEIFQFLSLAHSIWLNQKEFSALNSDMLMFFHLQEPLKLHGIVENCGASTVTRPWVPMEAHDDLLPENLGENVFSQLVTWASSSSARFSLFSFHKCNNNAPMERGVTTIAWNNYCWRFRSHRSALIFQTHKRRDMCTTRWEMENKFLNEFTRAHTKESTHLSEFNCRPRNDRDRHFPILRTDVNRCSSVLSRYTRGKADWKSHRAIYGAIFLLNFMSLWVFDFPLTMLVLCQPTTWSLADTFDSSCVTWCVHPQRSIEHSRNWYFLQSRSWITRKSRSKYTAESKSKKHTKMKEENTKMTLTRCRWKSRRFEFLRARSGESLSLS